MSFFNMKGKYEGQKKYSTLLNTPQYVPTGKQVDIEGCVDTSKYRELLLAIDEANISDAERAIFKLAATRFIDFSYENFAEYYCNTKSKDTQEIMEKLALVLVDFNDAIKNGFVKQNQFISELVKTDPLNKKVMDIAAKKAGENNA